MIIMQDKLNGSTIAPSSLRSASALQIGSARFQNALARRAQPTQLAWQLDKQTISRLRSVNEAWPHLIFQGEAVRATRESLPDERSLIGFVGGPWTLFVYAVEGSHKGPLIQSKRLLPLFASFCDSIIPLLTRAIQSQLDNGAEIVMIFDTAVGKLSPDLFQTLIAPQLQRIMATNCGQVGYYSKGTQPAHLSHSLFTDDGLAGIGIDHG